jgi:hypothetical protein
MSKINNLKNQRGNLQLIRIRSTLQCRLWNLPTIDSQESSNSILRKRNVSFTNFFKRLFSKTQHPGHLPYVPAPPPHQPDASSSQLPYDSANTDASFIEAESDMHGIAGTSIGFGLQEITQVDSQGQTKRCSQAHSHILGNGKLVGKIEDIAGVCCYCQAEATQAFEANLISLEEAQAKSLYDVLSASRCDACGTSTCCRHTRPIPMPDGSIMQLCVVCQKQLKGQIIKQKIVTFLLSPFMEDENTNG